MCCIERQVRKAKEITKKEEMTIYWNFLKMFCCFVLGMEHGEPVWHKPAKGLGFIIYHSSFACFYLKRVYFMLVVHFPKHATRT